MAGNYPNVPDHRIEYDRDGSIGFRINTSNEISEVSAATLDALNDENDATNVNIGLDRLGLIFPEDRDIVGYFIAEQFGPQRVINLEVSANTTNGLDGTWTLVAASPVNVQLTKPNYRSAIQTVSINVKRGIRFKGNDALNTIIRSWHLYGGLSAGSTKYLRAWRPNTAAGSEATGDAAASGSHFDWGDTPRGSSADRKFRVKNDHPTLTANQIVISFEALTDTTPSVPGQYLVSTDGNTFTATVNIGNLAAGALSSDLWVRRNTQSNAVLSLWSARMIIEADGGWS